MKNNLKIILTFLIANFFVVPNINSQEIFNFNVTNIEISENGNLFKGYGGGEANTNDGVTIIADRFEYDKLNTILSAEGNVFYKDTKRNIIIEANQIIYLKKLETIKASGDIKIIDNLQKIILTSENLKYSKIKTNKKIIINVARLEIQKDQITLIKAFKNIKDKKNYKLIIIGYGSYYDALKSFTKQNRLQKNVKIIRKVKNAHAYLKNAKLFVLCSKYEGFGNVLVEAGMNKIPIISSNCKHGPTEILENGKYGDLFQVGDHRELTRKIKNFINNPQKLIKKSNKFYKSLKRFNTKKIIIEYKKSLLNV